MSQNENTASARNAFSLLNIRNPHLWLVLGLGVFLVCLNVVQGNFGQLGKDSDDLLRFVQIQDYLRGQSWFETDQFRMGVTATGTDMHWSRVPDIPIILLTHLFEFFTTQDKALNYAISIWPPVCGVLFFVAMMIGAGQIRFLGNRKYLVGFTGILAVLFVVTNFRFESGAIDHHNLQFGLIALSMVWAMDSKMRASRYFLSGITTAICVAIGPEVYLFAAVICGFVALNWVVKGEPSRRATQSFGLGLSIGMAVLFFGLISPINYGVVACDALSLITVTAALCGGLGLIFVAKTSRYFGETDSLIRRFIGLIILGVFCLSALSFQAPQCLANPLDSLPADVTELWLGHITEAEPIFSLTPGWQAFIPMVMGPVLMVVGVVIFDFLKCLKRGGVSADLWAPEVLLVLLFLTAFALTVHQARFAPFTYIFALLILARWVAQNYQKGLKKGGTDLSYILCFALSIPMIWASLGLPFSSDMKESEPVLRSSKSTSLPTEVGVNSNQFETLAEKTNCKSKAVLATLNSVPKGLILANSNMAGPVLINTKHSVVSGNYHRNWEGISAEIEISTAIPAAAYELLVTHEIDYLFYCMSPDVILFSAHSPDGLMAKMKAGEFPDFLHRISDKSLENGEAILFEVVQK